MTNEPISIGIFSNDNSERKYNINRRGKGQALDFSVYLNYEELLDIAEKINDIIIANARLMGDLK